MTFKNLLLQGGLICALLYVILLALEIQKNVAATIVIVFGIVYVIAIYLACYFKKEANEEGKSNPAKRDASQLKRLLSWIVLVLCGYVFRVCIGYFFILVFWLLGKIFTFSEALFWVLILLEGSGALLITAAGLYYGSLLVVRASEAIKASHKGTRYVVVGIVNAVFYALVLILLVRGLVVTDPPYVAAYAASMIFGIILIVVGRTTSKKGIPPKTKNEAKDTPKMSLADSYVLQKSDEDYIDYLIKNNIGDTHVVRENYVEFYRVLLEFKFSGKDAALKRFDRIAKECARNDPDNVFFISYLCGALYANHVITKEESEKLSKKYSDETIDLYLERLIKNCEEP